MRKIGVLFILCLLVLACNDKDQPKKPDNLISENQMEQIFYDLYIINAAKGVNRKILETNGFVPETYVLTKYKIDSTQFAKSNAYYAFDTEGYNRIVENVKAKLEKEKKTFAELQKAEDKVAKRKRDSINKIKNRKKDSLNKIKQRKKDSIYQALQKMDAIN